MPYGKGVAPIWRKATAACKERGLTDFTTGSLGDQCRKKVAEAMAKKADVPTERKKR